MAVLGLMSATACGQTLAQRNWAGSGVSAEPWWRRAVFYRIDPAKFQDSDGDGKGDLAGVVQRLDYLQGLGVDALILDAGSEAQPSATLSPTGFDDLARAAVGHHLRVIVALGAPASQAVAADQQYLAQARSWLNQGAAGLYVPTPALAKVDGAGHIGVLLHQLRMLTNSFPGGRVLIAGAPVVADMDLVRALEKETQLTASAAITTTTPTAASLRAQLESALDGPPGAGATATRGASAVNAMLLAGRAGAGKDAASQDALNRTIAAMLLASRSAVILEYGQELGLAGEAGHAPLMQWTPTNVTPKAPPPPAPKAAEAPAAPKPAYEGFHPFVPPPSKNLLPAPKMPVIVVSDDPQPVVIDPNSLPGFTAGKLDGAATGSNGATANVAMEQADAKSLLSLYRQLIQLHHDNATVRNGTQTMLNHDAENAVVWVRRAPAGVRTSASVVVVCRLGGAVADAGTKVVRDLVGVSGDVVFIGEGR
jgi:alpha-glucosidase